TGLERTDELHRPPGLTGVGPGQPGQPVGAVEKATTAVGPGRLGPGGETRPGCVTGLAHEGELFDEHRAVLAAEQRLVQTAEAGPECLRVRQQRHAHRAPPSPTTTGRHSSSEWDARSDPTRRLAFGAGQRCAG